MHEGGNILIYFSAPLFNHGEISYNLKLTEKLEKAGFFVFLPQRDGIETQVLLKEKTREEVQKDISKFDSSKVLEADIFLIILDGRVPDEGACVELGIAYAQKLLTKPNKLLIGIKTDSRAAFIEDPLNAMIFGSLNCLVSNEEDLISALEDYRNHQVKD